MLAKLKSDGWRSWAGVVFVAVISLTVGLVVWFILSRGADNLSTSSPAPIVADDPVPLSIDDVGQAPEEPVDLGVEQDAVGLELEFVDGLSSKTTGQLGVEQLWVGWQLVSIDGVELPAKDKTVIRCRAMSTDIIPSRQVINQFIHQASRQGLLEPQNFHISQINNYYRCDLNLSWSVIIAGYEPGVCLNLSQLDGAFNLITGRGDQAKSHSAIPPWIGAACSADPDQVGQISVKTKQLPNQPQLAEVTYEGTFRAFIPKNDYSKVIFQIEVELEPGIYGVLRPIRIERL